MKRLLMFTFAWVACSFSHAQTPYLLKDIYSGANSGISGFLRFVYGTKLLFVANNNTNGNELWITDGTTANTMMVKDIKPGPGDSYISGFYEFNGLVFFEADNGANGTELWRTDGTTAGTVQVKDIRPGTSGGFDYSYFQPVWVHGGSFFFTAETNDIQDLELWKSDGTTAGTVLVKDIKAGAISSVPSGFYEFNNLLFFEADNGANGSELWKTDGTTAGTVQVKDIRPGTSGGFDYSNFQPVWVHGGSFFFTAETNDIQDLELWKSDGTTAGTVLVKDIKAGAISSVPSGFYEFSNLLFFEADNGANGAELWKTDGTTAGTVQVKDIRPGTSGGFDYSNFQPVWVHSGSFFFTAETNDIQDLELWKSDGTTAGTMLVKDIKAGAISSVPSGFYQFNNQLFFEADNGANGSELWKTDGSTAGTIQVKDIRPGTSGGFDYSYFQPVWVHGGSFYFTAETNDIQDLELWKSDGTTAGTVLLKDIQPGATSSNPNGFYVFGNQLFFEANNGANGAELWKTDGSTSGTAQVKDIRAGNPGCFDWEYFSPFIEWNGNFYFRAETYDVQDNEIWKSNGTNAGTVLVQDIYSGTLGSNAWGFTILNNTYLIFVATNGAYGEELWAMNMPGLSTRVEDFIASLDCVVYPNPSRGIVSLVIKSKSASTSQIEIYDTQGKILKKAEIETTENSTMELDFSGYGPGIYLLRVVNPSGAILKKVIIN